MAIRLGIGKSNFEALREDNNYYIDKTELIYDLVNNTSNEVTLFTRPRRFGKTLTMSMMESFFDIRRDSHGTFEGLAVTRHEDFCNEWMNRCPVLFISFKDVDALDFEGAYRMLETALSDVCIKLRDLVENEFNSSVDIGIFRRLMSKTANIDDVKNSLRTIMRMMYAVYGKKVILLIDEYDVPLAKANAKNTRENRLYEQMLDVMRGIMSASLKDNEYLEFAVITGCLRIVKESIFTGTNNFAAYSVLDKRFSEYFGFSQMEVDELLKAAELDGSADTIKEWYDGYVFGKSYVYCPWDVVNYVSDLIYDKSARPKNYWKNTSGNDIIKTFAADRSFDVSGKFEALMNGDSIRQRISDELTYDKIRDSEENLWSILLMTGYITKTDPDEDGYDILLRIPNEEISTVFQDKVVDLFRETFDMDVHKELMDCLWNGDEEEVGRIISDLLWNTISYHNYHENYYHAFLTGIFAGRIYDVKSDQENGRGRTDIVIRDRRNRRAVIIEAKKATAADNMEKACLDGKQQIIDKKYIQGLKGYKKIMCYGIGFFEKEALVRLLEM